MAMTDLQQQIYDKVRDWTAYAIGMGSVQVSPNYYYAWLLRAKLAPIEVINAELRKMVDSGTLRASAVKVDVSTPEGLYNANQDAMTATILALPENEIEKLTKSKKR